MELWAWQLTEFCCAALSLAGSSSPFSHTHLFSSPFLFARTLETQIQLPPFLERTCTAICRCELAFIHLPERWFRDKVVGYRGVLQNGWGWKAPLEVVFSKPLLKKGHLQLVSLSVTDAISLCKPYLIFPRVLVSRWRCRSVKSLSHTQPVTLYKSFLREWNDFIRKQRRKSSLKHAATLLRHFLRSWRRL